MTRNTSGFTLIEVMVAVIILSVGILALASGSGAVYRMLAAGKRSTKAGAIASERMELLRRQANATDPRCSAVAGGRAILTAVPEPLVGRRSAGGQRPGRRRRR